MHCVTARDSIARHTAKEHPYMVYISLKTSKVEQDATSCLSWSYLSYKDGFFWAPLPSSPGEFPVLPSVIPRLADLHHACCWLFQAMLTSVCFPVFEMSWAIAPVSSTRFSRHWPLFEGV